jgi:hypothetical protein
MRFRDFVPLAEKWDTLKRLASGRSSCCRKHALQLMHAGNNSRRCDGRFIVVYHFAVDSRTSNMCIALLANRSWSALEVYFSASFIVSQPKIAMS